MRQNILDHLVFFYRPLNVYRYWLRRKGGIRNARFNIVMGEHIKAHMKFVVDDIFSPRPIHLWLSGK